MMIQEIIIHFLVSPALLSAGADIDMVHINAGINYLERAAGHDPLIAR